MLTENISNSVELESGISLMTGRTGILLSEFLQLKEIRQEALCDYIESQVTYIMEHMYDVDNLSFSRGLLGVSSTLEFLALKYSLKYDSAVMDDVENVLYKSLIYGSKKNLSIECGFIGYFLYFLLRLSVALNKNSHYYKVLFLKECCILILYNIYHLLESVFSDKCKLVVDLKSIFQAYLLVKSFRLMNIQNNLSDVLLRELKTYLNRNNFRFEFSPVGLFAKNPSILANNRYIGVFLSC